jgi:hypothetical protein
LVFRPRKTEWNKALLLNLVCVCPPWIFASVPMIHAKTRKTKRGITVIIFAVNITKGFHISDLF